MEVAGPFIPAKLIAVLVTQIGVADEGPCESAYFTAVGPTLAIFLSVEVLRLNFPGLLDQDAIDIRLLVGNGDI